ncbi:MAG: hypothetical protein AAFP90_01835 [Planctomycetota bacterium]
MFGAAQRNHTDDVTAVASSGARFFGSVPLLPYKMALQHPCECEYTMGNFRTGSCAPMLLQRLPRDRRAIATSAIVTAGAVVAFP